MVARRLRLTVVVILCVLVGGLVFAGASAFALFTYPFDGQLVPSGGSFGFLDVSSVAVNDLNGDTYVADSGTGVVDVFDSTGAQLASLSSSTTPSGSFGGREVSVAANDGTGEVYVLDSKDNVVDVFDSTGNYVCQITGRATASASECNGPAGSATPAGGFKAPGGITVDQATGDVYVADGENGVVDIFSAGGAYLGQISLAPIEGSSPNPYIRGVAVDDFNGHVYVANSFTVVLYEFDAAGKYLTTWSGANTPAGSFGAGYLSVADDNTSGTIYVSETAHNVTDVFDSTGKYLTQFSHPSFNHPRGTAVDQASGKVYVSASESQPSVVDIFGPALVIPDVTTGSGSEIQPTSATLNGTVNPDGLALTGCHFEYGATTFYGQSLPCVPAAGSIPADSNGHAVSADLAGLKAGTTYHFRLEASNANGPNFGEDVVLSTPPPPSVDSATAMNIASSSADLGAKIDPNGFDTTYHFEWGTSTSYGTNVPVPDSDIGSGTSDVSVGTHLAGLNADTTYHWRVIAQNQNGVTTTSDHTFVYDTTGGGLPDNRAYEMVTPPQKNGALIKDTVFAVPPDFSEDGSRVIMSSIQCFAGAASCTAARQLEGEQFLFARTSSGWVTTPLAPPASQFEANSSMRVSAEAGTELFSMPVPPTNEEHLYARRADGSFVDVGPTTPPSGGALGPLSGADVETSDLSHVVYADRPVWPFDATTGQSSLYEYVGTGNSAPLLVGVSGGPGSDDLISKCGTSLEEVGLGTMSIDGGTVYFTAQACASGSGANTGTPVPANALYARIDQARTVKISERSPAYCTTAACQGSPAGDAHVEGASVDGSKAFFTSTQQLTDNASEDSQRGDTAAQKGCHSTTGPNGCNLYEYDFANPAGHNPIAVSAGDTSGGGPRVQGVVAISADGSHVYFVAKGVLTAAANNQGETAQNGSDNLYVFERNASHPEGHLAFVVALPGTDFEQWKAVGEEENVTPDGRFLVFASRGALTPDDTRQDGAQQVFRYDAQTGNLTRLSFGEHGFNDNGNRSSRVCVMNYFCPDDARIQRAAFGFLHAGPARSDPTMSHDGAYVFFESPVGLTPQALNEVQIGTRETGPGKSGPLYAENVYEWHNGHVYLISDGRDLSKISFNSAVQLAGSDATGANVFFSTADQLVPQDTDTQVDYYDARICTASDPCVAPGPPPLPPCLGEVCHGTPAGAPLVPSSPTATFNGLGNVTPGSSLSKKAATRKAARCPKGKRRSHGKCVRRTKRAGAKSHRGGK